ncbi:MAG: IS1634 family transposase, partial [Myxococcota bacterium]
NLRWLAENQGEIEERLFRWRRDRKAGVLFLYDVTSSYLEGEHNHFGAYGYNRDGKLGEHPLQDSISKRSKIKIYFGEI